MRKTLMTIAFTGFWLLILLTAPCQAQPQDAKTPYPSIAPLEQYLMERNAEIALARDAAAQPSLGMPTSWFSERMAMKLPSEVRTVSCAWCSDLGLPASTVPNFGIASCGPQSATTRRLSGPTFY